MSEPEERHEIQGIDIHTTAGKLADLQRRIEEATHAGFRTRRREAARQGQTDGP